MGEDQLLLEVIPNVRCPAAGSLEKALKMACAVLSLEFGRIPEYVYLPQGKRTCHSLRTSWDRWIESCLERYGFHSRHGSRLRLALKSTKRIFDAPCRECDRGSASDAKRKWKEHVARDVPLLDLPSGSDLCELRDAVRENLSGWGRRLEVERLDNGREPFLGEYVPDQQGCCEVPSLFGGTLACGEADYSGDWSLVRLGCAKTKGKFRTVTMQSAEVKRVLTPVHKALYNHITSFGWCVRGDVTSEDFETVVKDIREGELYISGDYSAATDNIYLPAVLVIVDEISKCPELSEEERSVLLGSFDQLRYITSTCASVQHRIKRGSMMGNLVSFPLLCLLNKSCFDIACNVRSRGDRSRVGRFNGDDCTFCGDSDFYRVWESVTSRYGLVVNGEKTGRSRRWLELNSQLYDARGHRMVAKATLGFLRPSRSEPGDMLSEVVTGLVGFSQRNILLVIIMLRHEIALRGVLGSSGCLTQFLRSKLIRMRWFRDAAILGGASTIEKGTRRTVDVTVGPPPREKFYRFVSSAASQLQRANTAAWLGVRSVAGCDGLSPLPVKPLVLRLDRFGWFNRRRSLPSSSFSRKFSWFGWRWTFVWPTPLLLFLRSYPVFGGNRSEWKGFHPFLSRRLRFVEVSPPDFLTYPPPASLLTPVRSAPFSRL